jgi:hypothetical protein
MFTSRPTFLLDFFFPRKKILVSGVSRENNKFKAYPYFAFLLVTSFCFFTYLFFFFTSIFCDKSCWYVALLGIARNEALFRPVSLLASE